MDESVSSSAPRQYLTFKVIDEVFGINVFSIREILEYTKVTKVPQFPDYVRGVINLRGSVVPVICMHLVFGMKEAPMTVDTCIIVIETSIGDEQRIVGAVVDSVQEVVELEQSQIEPPPKIGTRLNIEFIEGMGKHNGQFIILLDSDKIFKLDSIDELVAPHAAGAEN